MHELTTPVTLSHIVQQMKCSDEQGIWDSVVIGAGAAGLMTAIQLARKGHKTLVLDTKKKIGAKILMSGGTRCNVTNQKVIAQDYATNFPKVLQDVLKSFSPIQARNFFEDIQVSLKLDPLNGKYFPASNSAETVLKALTKALAQSGAKLQAPVKINRVNFKNNLFHAYSEDATYLGKTLVLCTGGLSYPSTGSDGRGYSLAKHFGHHVIPTIPSLTPLLTNDKEFKSLMGIALDVELSLKSLSKRKTQYAGPLLFTHFGFSGPTALNISRHWKRLKDSGEPNLLCNFLPHVNETQLIGHLDKARANKPHSTLKQTLSTLFPKRFLEVLLNKSVMDGNQTMGHFKKTQAHTLCDFIYRCSLPISGIFGYAKAEVTAGGLDMREIKSSTLESKLQPNLFFAGEILDVDGRIGGFNFQWAWSSGVVAARGISKNLAIGI